MENWQVEQHRRVEKKGESVPFEKTFVYRETLDNRIGGRIRAMRRRQGMTQRELAEKSGMRQSHISEIENARRQIKTSEVAKKLAKVFDVDYRYFI